MNKFDQSISAKIHGLKLGPLDYALVVPGMLFGSYVMPFFIILCGLLLGWKYGLVCLMAAITTVAIANPLKHVFGRARPAPLEADRAFKLRKLVTNPAFPSGDSAQAGMGVTLLMVLGPLDWPYALGFLPAIPLCMFSRVYFGAHWIGDTIAGAIIGSTVALVYAYWFADFVGRGLPAA